MPRIRGAGIEEHHELVWVGLAAAVRQLLLEQDYDSITMGHIAARGRARAQHALQLRPDKGALHRARAVELLSGVMRAGVE